MKMIGAQCQPSTLQYQIVPIDQHTTAVILWNVNNVDEEVFRDNVLRFLKTMINLRDDGSVFIGGVQHTASLIPLAWQQCREMEKCSISLQQRICFYDNSFNEREHDLIIPEHYTEKLHNLIMTGDSEKARQLSESIFAPIRNRKLYIANEHLIHSLTMLLNDIVNDMLSIQVYVDEALPCFTEDMNLEDIASSFISYIEHIANKASDPRNH